MKITPMEVSGKKFKTKWRGYDQEEVREFLEMIASDMEDMIRESRYFEEELSRKNSELGEFKSREQTLKDTLILAQKLARDMKNTMAKEAQVVLSEAEMEAEKMVRQAHDRAMELENEIRDLRNQRLAMVEEMRSIINTHMKMLDLVSEHVDRSDQEDQKISRLTARAKSSEE
jgi:cell division initiation protein